MADKLTLLELHLHAEDNEFQSDMQLSSDIGDLLRRRLGLGSSEESESATLGSESETATLGSDTDRESGTSSRPSVETPTDGGDTVQVDEPDEESEGSSAVVEIDADADLDEEDEVESSGRSKGKALLVLVLLVGIALLARKYLDGEELEDEFEEL